MAASTIYLKFIEAHPSSLSNLEPIKWLEEVSKTSPMCNYWKMILGLQLEILLYVRSPRESNFKLYVAVLARFMKWFFAMYYYKYARWCSVHLFCLSNLEFTAPSLYEEFNSSNFSFQKNMRNFSRLSPNSVHDQNNEKIKGLGGATHLLNIDLTHLVSRNGELLVQNLYVC